MFAKYEKNDGRFSFSVSDNGGISISDDEYKDLFDAQERGLTIVERDGYPVAVENIPNLSHAQQTEQAEYKKQALISAAIQSISVIQLKLQAGRKLTTTEIEKLNVTLDYIDAVTAIDNSTAPDIEWPVSP